MQRVSPTEIRRLYLIHLDENADLNRYQRQKRINVLFYKHIQELVRALCPLGRPTNWVSDVVVIIKS